MRNLSSVYVTKVTNDRELSISPSYNAYFYQRFGLKPMNENESASAMSLEEREAIETLRAQLTKELLKLLEHELVPAEFKDALRPYLEEA